MDEGLDVARVRLDAALERALAHVWGLGLMAAHEAAVGAVLPEISRLREELRQWQGEAAKASRRIIDLQDAIARVRALIARDVAEDCNDGGPTADGYRCALSDVIAALDGA